MSGLRSARLVGRDAEMEQLRRAVEDVRGGDPTLLLVEGEAGIGKTRLVAEAIAQLGAPADLVATGGGFALGSEEIPFVAVSGVLRSLVRGLGPAVVLEAGGPALGVLWPGLTGGALGQHDRGEVLGAFTSLVEHLATQQMLWLVFEDLHWVDSSSRELISYLLGAVGSCQLAVICTRRTHDEPPSPQLQEFVAELVRHPRGRRMTLDRLTAAQVADQVADLVGGAPEPGFAESVAARSQGNPFLAEELVDSHGDGHVEVSELMLARVVGLGDAARRVVQAAAVGDGHADHSLLSRVCGLPADDFARAVASATASSVLEADPSGDRYVFRHALLREAVDRALLPDERKQWHRRWAEELEADPVRLGVEPARIAAAEHWYRADDPARAFEATVRAENAAWALRASPEQARLNLRLIELMPRVPKEVRQAGTTRLECVWTAIGAMNRSGDWAEAWALAGRELEQPEATTEPAWRIFLQLARRDCAERLGQALTEPPDIDADVAELLRAPPNNLVTEALLWYREVLWDLGRMTQADRLLDRASEVSDAMVAQELAGEVLPGNDPPDGLSTVTKSKMMVEVHVAWRDWLDGRSDEAVARVATLLPLATRPGAYDGQDSMVLTSYAVMLTRLGRCREAVAVIKEAMRLLGAAEANRAMWLDLVAYLGDALFALGEWDENDHWLEATSGVDSNARSTADLAVTRAALCCARGELDAAETWLGVATRAVDDDRASRTGPCRWLLADLTAARGDVPRAREHLESSWARPDHELEGFPLSDLFLLAARLEADAPDDGSPDRVARIRKRGEGMLRRGDLGLAWSAHLEAELLRAAGSSDPQPWSEAEVAWGRVEHPHQQGWALLRQAECLVAGGDREAAVAPLTRALQIGQRLGAQPLVDAAAGLARRARLTVGGPSVPRQRAGSLTERELDVLHLLADGCSNGRIAETLFISPKTASVHVSHILTKLDVSTRTEAAAVAIRQQLLDEDER